MPLKAERERDLGVAQQPGDGTIVLRGERFDPDGRPGVVEDEHQPSFVVPRLSIDGVGAELLENVATTDPQVEGDAHVGRSFPTDPTVPPGQPDLTLMFGVGHGPQIGKGSFRLARKPVAVTEPVHHRLRRVEHVDEGGGERDQPTQVARRVIAGAPEIKELHRHIQPSRPAGAPRPCRALLTQTLHPCGRDAFLLLLEGRGT